MPINQPGSLPKEIVHDKLTQQDNTILAVIANHSSISFNSLYDKVKKTINKELLK